MTTRELLEEIRRQVKAPAVLTLTSVDHPLARGACPQPGDIGIQLNIPLDDGRVLCLRLGEPGARRIEGTLAQIRIDDEAGRLRRSLGLE